jgi:hypothetical protein
MVSVTSRYAARSLFGFLPYFSPFSMQNVLALIPQRIRVGLIVRSLSSHFEVSIDSCDSNGLKSAPGLGSAHRMHDADAGREEHPYLSNIKAESL